MAYNPEQQHKTPEWTLLSNHGHVLVCLARHPEAILRDVAQMVGITERAAQRIVTDLENDGMIERHKMGRQNTYSIDYSATMRHPNESETEIGSFLKSLGVPVRR